MAMSLTTEIWKPNMTTATSKKPKTSSLPHNGELREEDDWTKVKDPKEKKRIQNRVAQRTYRHRMKARLGELQARLESHEARRSQSVDASEMPGNTTPNSFKGSDIICLEGSASPSASHHSDSHLPPPQHHQHLQHHHQMTQQMMHPHQQPNLYEQPVEDPENSLFSQAATRGLLNSPPTSQHSPSPHGLLSPPTHMDQQTQQVHLSQQQQQQQQQPPQQQLPQGEGKGSQNFMMDCLRFQSQLLDRLNNIQPDPALGGPFPPAAAVQMAQGEPVSMPGFTPTGTSTMDFTFETSVDMWKPEDGMKIQQQASPDSTYFQNLTLPGTSAAMITEPATMTAPAPAAAPVAAAPRMADKNAPLEERFASIMGQVEAAGFESFDAMASAYYTQTFAQSSSLTHEQRLSRKRGLPQVLSDVHTATGQWSDWERNGFQEEILKIAETMLTSEGGNARQQLANKVDALLEAQNAGNAAAAGEAVLSMKRTIQEQLPNSWALSMALAADSRQSWQRDRSNTALATNLLLNFSGRIPNEQLLRLVGACL